MCDYQYPAGDTRYVDPTVPQYCQRASQFWVQSLLSTHNMHACPHHLARIVREVEKEARLFDLNHKDSRPDGTDKRFRKYGTHPDDDGRRLTGEEANYARVTVKVYDPR